MQRTKTESRPVSVECPTCGVACPLAASVEVEGDLVASTRQALFGEVARGACPDGHPFFVYDC